MKIIAVIPARYEASRFPGKLMKDLCGKPVILRTYEAALSTNLFHEVIVATDSAIIHDFMKNEGAKTFLSVKEHDCGSDRIAEAIEHNDADIIINIQGDEPFTDFETLNKLVSVFKSDTDQAISLATPMHTLTQESDIQNPNNVKVITDIFNNAIYFSRSAIPYRRDNLKASIIYKHVGIYAFRKHALMHFYKSTATPLELTEKIECIRYLEHGHKIRMVHVDHATIGIDTIEDLEKARILWSQISK